MISKWWITYSKGAGKATLRVDRHTPKTTVKLIVLTHLGQPLPDLSALSELKAFLNDL